VGEAPGMAKISPDGNTLVVSNRKSGSVSIVDAATLRVRSVFSGCPGATDVAILPDSSKAFIACSDGHQVLALQLQSMPSARRKNTRPRADALLALLDVGKTPVSLALKPDGGEIFVSNYGSGSVSEIDTSTNEVGAAYWIGSHPVRGLVSADNSTLYVSDFDADSLGVFSVEDAELVGTARTGDGPDALAFSNAGHLLFAVDARSGDVSVIRTLTHTLFTMLPAGSKPNDIAVKAFNVR
jgi:YVTN family beta-propeller protein